MMKLKSQEGHETISFDEESMDQNPKEAATGIIDGMSDLPICVAHKIFSKFPFTTIGQCKCVCKAWRKLLSDPDFSTYYAANSIFLLYLPSTTSRTGNFCLQQIYENQNCSPKHAVLQVPCLVEPRSFFEVISSINGFLCFLELKWHPGDKPIFVIHDASIHLYNPFTGDYFALPGNETRTDVGMADGRYYHFGVNLSRDTIKVLRITLKQRHIFTVGVDEKWRNLSVSSTELPDSAVVTAFHGSFCWIQTSVAPSLLISTFDIAEEKLGQIAGPRDVVLGPWDMVLGVNKFELSVLGDKLSLVDSSSCSQITIWTMQRYAIEGSWTKIIILTSWFPSGICWASHFCPIAILKEREMLIEPVRRNREASSPNLISCNIELRKCSLLTNPPYRPAYRYGTFSPSFSSFTDKLQIKSKQ